MARIDVAPPAPGDWDEFSAIGVPLREVATAPLLPTLIAPTADSPALVTMPPLLPAPPPPPPTLPIAVGVKPLNEIPPPPPEPPPTASIVVVLTCVILAATGFKENKFVTFVGFFNCMDGV